MVTGVALQLSEPPALDGRSRDLIRLSHFSWITRISIGEAKSPTPAPESFSASAVVNWDDQALYLGVEVIKPDVIARNPKAAPLLLDNEPDEIHADGLQVYLKLPMEDEPARISGRSLH